MYAESNKLTEGEHMTQQQGSSEIPAADTAIIDEAGNLVVGARVIPVPKSISPEAQAAMKSAPIRHYSFPDLDDTAGWEENIRQHHADMELMTAQISDLDALDEDGRKPLDAVETTEIAGVTVHIARPPKMAKERERYAYLIIHGGSMVYGAGHFAKFMSLFGAGDANCTTYSVDYRVPPHHPYPAALDDTVAVYCELLQQYGAENMIMSGGSGGANIAAASVLKLRDMGLPMPAALVLETPELDLTESGDTFQTNRHLDYVLQGSLVPISELYANGHDLSSPYLSPLFGDFSLGFPPTYIQSGTRDLFLSNAVRMHRALLKADIVAELHIWEAMPHGFFCGTAPEDKELRASVSKFIQSHFQG